MKRTALGQPIRVSPMAWVFIQGDKDERVLVFSVFNRRPMGRGRSYSQHPEHGGLMIDELIAAGKAAVAIRHAEGFDYRIPEHRAAHEAAIAKIDAVVDRMRAAHPERYWLDTDPAYQFLKAGWAADRAALKAKRGSTV